MMKRYCLDGMILVLGLVLIYCVGALIEGLCPAWLSIGGAFVLCVSIYALNAESERCAKLAAKRKQIAKRQAMKRRRQQQVAHVRAANRQREVRAVELFVA